MFPQVTVELLHSGLEAVPMGSISMSEDETVELIYSLMEVGSDTNSLVELS